MTTACPICGKPMRPRVMPWSYYCENCDHWTSHASSELGRADEELFRSFSGDEDPLGHIAELRRDNFLQIFALLRRLGLERGALADIGCASGQFLELAREQGWQAVGVEPKPRMAQVALAHGHTVRTGLFPECFQDNEKFNVIVFNDVLEHISEAGVTLRACCSHLLPSGYVVLTLPDSHGIFYNVSMLLNRLGFPSYYDRMWQRVFYSPHLHYFSISSIELMAKQCGFKPALPVKKIPSIRIKGLWNRICLDSSLTFFSRVVAYLGTLLLSPVSALIPDTFVIVLEPLDSNANTAG